MPALLTKILTIVLGLALLVMFIFFERRFNAIFKGRSRKFYIGLAATGVACLAILYTVDFLYVLIGLTVLIGFIAIAPWLAEKWANR
jgi:hypothetical protein